MTEFAANLQGVSKRYRLGVGSLREALARPFAGLRRRRHGSAEDLWALQEVSFSLHRGETLGVIGPNGAGKSTLLKLLAGVAVPTKGTIAISGRVCPLIEVGAGFHPDLTGRENIFLNGAILGLTRREIQRKFDSIVEFSGLAGFIDTPVKRYSSGMYMRLGFAISAHVEPDILLVDEVLAVGDYAFQQRCLKWMANYRRKGTVVFVSHNLEAVRWLCDRALLLEHGRVVVDGAAPEAIAGYHARLSQQQAAAEEAGLEALEGRRCTGEAEIRRVWLRNGSEQEIHGASSGEVVRICCETEFLASVEAPVFGFFIAAPDGTVVYDMNTQQRGIPTGRYEKGQTARLEFCQPLPLAEGTYQVSVGITRGDLKAYCCWKQNALSFFVRDDSGCRGLASLGSQVAVDGRLLG